jgi:hypothetical protein
VLAERAQVVFIPSPRIMEEAPGRTSSVWRCSPGTRARLGALWVRRVRISRAVKSGPALPSVSRQRRVNNARTGVPAHESAKMILAPASWPASLLPADLKERGEDWDDFDRSS